MAFHISRLLISDRASTILVEVLYFLFRFLTENSGVIPSHIPGLLAAGCMGKAVGGFHKILNTGPATDKQYSIHNSKLLITESVGYEGVSFVITL